MTHVFQSLLLAIANATQKELARQVKYLKVPVLRRLGIRTCAEIDQERYALKALRGDFRHVATTLTQNEPEAASKALRWAEP